MIGIAAAGGRKVYIGDGCPKCGNNVRLMANDKCASCSTKKIDKSWRKELARKQAIRRRIEDHQNRDIDDYGFD